MRTLGAAGYHAAYADGRALPLAEAVADALAHPADAPCPCPALARNAAGARARAGRFDRIVQELGAIAPRAKLLQLSTHT